MRAHASHMRPHAYAVAAAGLMGLLLAAVQRCSMGQGAAMPAALISASSSFIYAMSLKRQGVEVSMHYLNSWSPRLGQQP